jgi:hypothetical protein
MTQAVGFAPNQRIRQGAKPTGGPKKIYPLLSLAGAVHIKDIVVRTGLNWSEVLANLFGLDGLLY